MYKCNLMRRILMNNTVCIYITQALMKAQLRIVDDKVDKKRRGVTNSLKAYEGILPDAPGDSFKPKKGRSSGGGSGGDMGGAKKRKSSGSSKGSPGKRKK